MAKYRVGFQTPAPNAVAPYCAIRAIATRIRISQIEIAAATAVASTVTLAPTPAQATPGTPTTTQLSAKLSQTDAASTVAFDTAWAPAPTLNATPVWEAHAPIAGVIGNGRIWTFPDSDRLIIEPGAQILLWNPGVGAGCALSVNVLFED